MGHRCNLVIIENGQTTVYYDHWAANRLDIELLWGAEIARAFIESREPNPSCWLDSTWAEGGCIVDYDTKHLLWFGGEASLYEASWNMMHQYFMNLQWQSWTVEWAKDGVFDIAKKVGIPISEVTCNIEPDSEMLFQPYTYEDTFFYANSVFSFIEHGELHWAILQGESDCLENVELTLEKIVDLVLGFSESDFERGKVLDPDWGYYRWGVHLNFDTSSFQHWNPEPIEGLEARIKKRLPEWSVVFHGPDYLWHEALVPAKDWPIISQQSKLNQIKSYRDIFSRDNNRKNPIESIIKNMADEGATNIQVNPLALEDRKGRQDLLHAKIDILDHLEREVRRQP
ncbi:MAG: hypothetical protein ABJO36_01175 [Litorimonas sp.]